MCALSASVAPLHSARCAGKHPTIIMQIAAWCNHCVNVGWHGLKLAPNEVKLCVWQYVPTKNLRLMKSGRQRIAVFALVANARSLRWTDVTA